MSRNYKCLSTVCQVFLVIKENRKVNIVFWLGAYSICENLERLVIPMLKYVDAICDKDLGLLPFV